MGVYVQRNSNTPLHAERAVDTGDGFIRLENATGDGTSGTRIVPKSDVKSISGKVDDVKAPSK